MRTAMSTAADGVNAESVYAKEPQLVITGVLTREHPRESSAHGVHRAGPVDVGLRARAARVLGGDGVRPYYDDGGITLYLGDCRDLLDAIDADVVITDPPYGETSLLWDRVVPHWIGSVGPRSMWLFGSLRSLLRMGPELDATDWKLAQDIVWEKHNSSGLHADRFRRVHELGAHFYRGQWADVFKAPVYTHDAVARTIRKKPKPAHWHGETDAGTYRNEDGGPRLMRSVIRVRSEHGHAEHPTQKPLGIIAPLIAYSCPPGGTVLDPFAGSGSPLRAAKDAGRRAIGIEIDERWCEVAVRRLAQETLVMA